MADVPLTVQTASPGGIVPNYQAIGSTTDVYLVPNNGNVLLHFKKSGAGIANIALQTPGTVAGLAIADGAVAVPATTGDVMVDSLPPDVYNTGGNIRFTTDNFTGLTVACVRRA